MKILFSVHWVIAAAAWYFINGMLHDIFVLIDHKGSSYDRELLRLLMDGHVLMLSGSVLFMCYLMMLNKIQCGAVIGSIVAAGMLVYCVMIFPFLESFVTMALSIIVLVVCIYLYPSFPNIYKIMQNYR